ncbi:preprotein translocase subunit TatC [Halorubrum sp. BOL3-1]|uniref:twin-arginine translocase subunit TatC n=1 Tax=Halorubrum sp. BOL3-1 TaxID=2497325 RepID=UPI0010050AC4|nr:twin-arginine translocase subunit TatC [Halorubrum sp. BOL3-1]QAU13177.1 preprotein translocase subunit TatC [Halorubrum sp. BOL3-1]
MDDSDRSRDDDSAAADGSTDEVAPDGDDAEGRSPDADAADPETPDEDGSDGDTFESEVTPEVTPQVGVDEDESAGDDPLDPDEVVEAEDAARAESVDGDDAADGGDGETTTATDETAAAGAVDDGAAAAEPTESLGDGGTPATSADAAAVVDDEDEPFEGIEGPETDEEMPLAAHIEEMMRRLAVVFLIGGLATLVVVTESTELINYFWSYHIPAPLENRPRLYGPLELPLTRLKVAGLAGVVVGLPAFVYETYRFMRPGLYQTERRYYLAAVPTSLVLGGVGMTFAHFLVLPAIFSYFTTYTADAATIAFGLAETFNLIVIMLSFMAIVFQIPLFIMLAIMMNLVTRQWLEAKRLIFWGSFLGIAFLFSPDPTGMAPIIVTLTMIVLFEGTLAALRWTGN